MKQLLVLLLLLCAANVSAQDVIVKKDGSTILSKVLEVGQTEIKYKRFDNLDGPTYTIGKSELQAINYQNGAKDTFSEYVREENKYLPNNQNEGTQRYNDNALLALDFEAHNTEKSIKRLKTWGWISGITSVVISPILGFFAYDSSNDSRYSTPYTIACGVFLIGGIGTSIYCFSTAHKRQKEAKLLLQSSSIFQYEFKFENNSSLSAGIDILGDHTLGNNTLGLGLRYNF